MRILVVNWQDRENPHAGGAEIHLHEIFGRLVRWGHDVTLLCGGWPGATPRTTLDGIDVHRAGTRYTFPFVAYRYYLRHLVGREFDVLVEDLNKVPLHTPHWRGARPLALVHHLFGEVVFHELPPPAAALVWLSERPLAAGYRGVPFEAVSRSTADDLARRGVCREAITVIYQGIDTARLTPDPGARSSTPLFAYLGRLKRYKRVDLVLRAFHALAHPVARLAIAGTGDDAARLRRVAYGELDLGERVRFLGFISEDEKRALLRQAWAVVYASPKEGWGITNLEAAACGTAVVASNSPGLRESVRDGETGTLVPHGDVPALAGALRQLAASPSLVAELGANGRRFAESFTWERAARETEAHLIAVAAGTAPR